MDGEIGAMEKLLCWIEGHPGTASWVQAVGAIAAVIAAFLLAFFESRRQWNNARQAAAREVALAKMGLERAELAFEEIAAAFRDAMERLEYDEMTSKVRDCMRILERVDVSGLSTKQGDSHNQALFKCSRAISVLRRNIGFDGEHGARDRKAAEIEAMGKEIGESKKNF